ncbi:MAG: prevent-host-death family protein [bacterium]|nr:prevent-host-death family protein [bacterium]
MKASMLDFRRRGREIIEALERGESVTLTYRGREVAEAVPSSPSSLSGEATEHPAFGLWGDCIDESPSDVVRRIRKGRVDAV